MREIVLDTETTGLSHKSGHRIIEIGCVELKNHMPTGRTYHTYINPMRDVPADASAVSGLTTEFVSKFKPFDVHVDEFLAFIGDDILVIHNASFDMGFLNAELERCFKPLLPMTRALDTVVMARKMFPGSPANLNALCKRFGIDLSERTKHGALLDAQLLARVYLELKGGRQRALDVQEDKKIEEQQASRNVISFPLRAFPPTEEELSRHAQFIQGFKNSLWNRVD